VALLAGTRLAMPSSARGFKPGGFTGYAHAGGLSAPSAVEEKIHATQTATVEVSFLMPPPFVGSLTQEAVQR
jgi:hypothetical protein